MHFSDLGLSADLLRNIQAQNYTTPTAIQAQAIPMILQNRDVMGGSQTGTGKTAAFALPLLQNLAEAGPKRGPAPRILVLAPTRELAAQVHDSFLTYGKGLNLHSAVIFGGVGYGPQIQALKRGIDILVATPGRLLDHLNEGRVDLSRIETLVLDEADRMLDMGFLPDMKRLFKKMPGKRQNLLFSATYSNAIRRLAADLLNKPVEIDVAPRNTAAERVEQMVHPVAKNRKRHLLSHLIREGDWRQVLVFARTKHGSDRLARQLRTDGVQAEAIHGGKSQNARTRVLAGFKQGKVRVLVATDIAARGLDIDSLPHVVNHDLPQVADDYVHRIGRTGRAGAGGSAVSLVSPEEFKLLREIEKLLKTRIPSETITGFETATPAEKKADQPRKSQDIKLDGNPRRRRRNSKRRRNRRGVPAGV